MSMIQNTQKAHLWLSDYAGCLSQPDRYLTACLPVSHGPTLPVRALQVQACWRCVSLRLRSKHWCSTDSNGKCVNAHGHVLKVTYKGYTRCTKIHLHVQKHNLSLQLSSIAWHICTDMSAPPLSVMCPRAPAQKLLTENLLKSIQVTNGFYWPATHMEVNKTLFGGRGLI